MIFYHGSPNQLEGNISPVEPKYAAQGGRQGYRSDFGQGFYVSNDIEFASMKACGHGGDNGYLYSCQFNPPKDIQPGSYRFESPDAMWLMYIAYNRKRLTHDMSTGLCYEIEKFKNSYDIIIGPTANDRAYNSLKQFWEPVSGQVPITHRLILKCMSETALSTQYTFLTQRACDTLSYKLIKEFHGAEKKGIEAIANARSLEGALRTDKIISENMWLKGLIMKDMIHIVNDYNISFVDLPLYFNEEEFTYPNTYE